MSWRPAEVPPARPPEGAGPEVEALRATGGAPLLLGLRGELYGNTLHADVCRDVLAAGQEAWKSQDGPPHPELNATHPEAGSVLHWAAAQGLKEASLAILQCRHFTLVNARRGSDGSTALHIAAAQGLPEVVEALLQHPDFVSVAGLDRDGFTALHGAAWRGHLRCVELLLACPRFSDAVGVLGNFDVLRPAGHWAREAAEDYDMRSALHMAACAGHAKICDAILSHGPAEVTSANAKNRINSTALHMAARKANTPVCLAILGHSEFTTVDARDARGNTVLHWAAQQANGDICNAVLKRGDFTAVEAKDLRGRTAMEIARELGYHEIRRLILGRLGHEGISKVE